MMVVVITVGKQVDDKSDAGYMLYCRSWEILRPISDSFNIPSNDEVPQAV